jgi:hypothetical protein
MATFFTAVMCVQFRKPDRKSLALRIPYAPHHVLCPEAGDLTADVFAYVFLIPSNQMPGYIKLYVCYDCAVSQHLQFVIPISSYLFVASTALQ